jgi:hypothetical protein
MSQDEREAGGEGKTPPFSDLSGEGDDANFSGLFEGGDPISSLKGVAQNVSESMLNPVQGSVQRFAGGVKQGQNILDTAFDDGSLQFYIPHEC